MNVVRARMKPYIQPFERVLALQELRALASGDPRALGLLEETSTDFEVKTFCTSAHLATRLSYWESVEHESTRTLTTQALRESTVNVLRSGVAIDTLQKTLPFTAEVPLPNRRCLRYGTHGVHEYRGKFFPQLVRSIVNISGIKLGDVVADPMCGSGTTLVEAILASCNGLGLDMNPLSVLMARTKTGLLSADASVLADCYSKIRGDLGTRQRRAKKQLTYFDTLPEIDRNYLRAWFRNDVLVDLDEISVAIEKIRYTGAKELMRISLSNILRQVSWQKEDDLRVRREIHSDAEIDTKQKFLVELGRSVRAIFAFLRQNGPVTGLRSDIRAGDARYCSEIWGRNSVDVVITSPPYATALPYLDTDRLSLCYLGLLPRPAHRRLDQQMIGNREVTEGQRRSYWARFEKPTEKLPSSVRDVILRIDSLNSTGDVGFRRRNLPALLAKYFFDMTEVLREIHTVLKPGRFSFVVIGNNHTLAGGRRVEIPTAQLLQDIALSIGLEVGESLSMEMLTSRDIFRRNAVSSEEILTLRKPV